jgi:hypothetical protein
MSNLIQVNNTVTMLSWNVSDGQNKLLQDPYFRMDVFAGQELMGRLWPTSRLTGYAMNNEASRLAAVYWEPLTRWKCGVRARKLIIGITRDSAGNPLGGCTVKCFRTSDDVLMTSCVSDTNGNYEISTPDTGTCYLVAYKATGPDVLGTTINTLQGV